MMFEPQPDDVIATQVLAFQKKLAYVYLNFGLAALRINLVPGLNVGFGIT